MKAEIITIGDEILYGHTIDTNSAFIGQRLSEIGVSLDWITSVGDDREKIKEAFKNAYQRSGAVIVTGGLGPTHDDVTKHVFIDFFDMSLVLNEEILDSVRQMFRQRGLKMPESNIDQAMVPDAAEVLENSVGTAPGVHLERAEKHFFLVPGVPREMERMVEDKIIPILLVDTRGKVTHHLNLRTTGISESGLYNRLEDLDGLEHLAFLPSLYGVDLRITIKGDSLRLCKERSESLAQKIDERAGEYIYTRDRRSLEEVVGEELKKKDLSVALAESSTGGLIASRLTDMPGSSEYFETGIVAYNSESKIKLLGVPKETIKKYKAVSPQIAQAMAEGIRKLAKVDIGLSETGILGPTGGTEERPVGLVYLGLSTAQGTISEKIQLGTERAPNKIRSSQAAMEMLRRFLIKR